MLLRFGQRVFAAFELFEGASEGVFKPGALLLSNRKNPFAALEKLLSFG